jgi:anti-sigma regulatory factor (Ser/Thr protein kinase)
MIQNSKKIRIENSLDGIHQLEAFVEDICYEYNIINSYYSNIQVALCEAVQNVGNVKKSTPSYEISFFSDSKGLHFLIADEDEGFDVGKFNNLNVDDLLEVDDQNEGENGLLVIRLLVDEMNVSSSVIELVFYISSINYSLTLERKKNLEQYFKNVVLLKA